MQFSSREVRDLGIAWLTLGAAFTILLSRNSIQRLMEGQVDGVLAPLAEVFVLSMITVGVGFLLHELAHKVVAIRFGQIAEFRADYSMLFVAIVGAFIGFLFAAPGAVVHRGRITERENGLIALAGPVTNIVFAVVFFALLLVTGGFAERVAYFGLLVNLLLAGFNMIPFGPLDGKKVLAWNKLVFAVVAVPTIGLAALVFFTPLLL